MSLPPLGFAIFLAVYPEEWKRVLFTMAALLICVPGPLVVLSLFDGFENFYKEKGANKMILFLVFVVSGIVGIASWKLFPQESGSAWGPPKLAEDCQEITVGFGSAPMSWNLGLVKERGPVHPVRIDGKLPISVSVVNNRLHVEAEILVSDRRTVRYKNGQIGSIPYGWDKNFTDDAFEVVDENKKPRLQLFYRQPDHVEITGLFVSSNMFVAAYGQPLQYGTPAQAHPPIALSPLFRYPSFKYRGQFAEGDGQAAIMRAPDIDTALPMASPSDLRLETIHGKLVRLQDLGQHIASKRFEGCLLIGPVTVIPQGCSFYEPVWTFDVSPEELFVEGNTPHGIAVTNCVFIHCRFVRVKIAGNLKLKSQFFGQGGTNPLSPTP